MLEKIRSDRPVSMILNLLTGHKSRLYNKQSNINTFTLPDQLANSMGNIYRLFVKTSVHYDMVATRVSYVAHFTLKVSDTYHVPLT